MKRTLTILFFGLVGCASHGAGVVRIESIAASPADVSTIDGIMRAFYEVVNVAPDAPRQWSRDHTLYSPWLRFVSIGTAKNGRLSVDTLTHQQLVDETEPMIRDGFHEVEMARVTRVYGNIAHIDSSFDSTYSKRPGKRDRGVNSIELYFDGVRWWISACSWQMEDAEHPVPKELLPAAGVASAAR